MRLRSIAFQAVALLGMFPLCANDVLAPSAVEARHEPKRCTAGYVLAISPTTATWAAGASQSYAASVQTPCGAEVQNVVVTWTFKVGGIATTDGSTSKQVVLTGVTAGSDSLIATSDGGGRAAAALTVTGVASCTPTATNLCPGDNLNTKVQAQASGTAFTLGAGKFVQQQIFPKANDTFTGVYGQTILTGARDISAGPWTSDGAGHFYITGQTQQNDTTNTYTCATGHSGCGLPEQLWVNQHLYERMTTVGGATTGKWYFDYAANRIYLPFNATGSDSLIETSVTHSAFVGGGVSGVVINTLVVEKYANPAQAGAVGYGTSPAWKADSLEVRNNHGIGIRFTGTGWQIRKSYVHHNGEMGISGTGANGLAYGNIVDTNAVAYFGSGSAEECSGAKFVSTTGGLVVRQNFFRGNWCNGLWLDTNNRFATLDSNTVDGNFWSGIIDEVGYNSTICANTVTNNGADPLGSAGVTGTSPAGIVIANSRDAEVCSNTLSGNTHGITGYDSDRGSPTPPSGFGTHDVCNMSVHDNNITQTNANRAGGVADNDPGTGNPYACGNSWFNNTYTLGASTRFRWTGNTNYTWLQWIGFGQDAGSSETGQ